MADFSKLSDADLEALANNDFSKVSDGGLEELAKEPPKPSGMSKAAGAVGSGLLSAVRAIGHAYDRIGPAPLRAVVKDEMDNGLSGASPISTYVKQMVDGPETAPTGEQLAAQAGLDNVYRPKMYGGKSGALPAQMTNAELVGGVAQAGLDPMLVVGPGKVLGMAGNGIAAAGRGAAKIGAGAIDTVLGTDLALKSTGFAEQSAKEAAQSISKIFNPKQADDFGEFVQIAKKNGIDPAMLPESVEFGKGSFLDSAARAKREGPTGEARMDEFKEGYRQVQEATEKKISQISGGQTPSNPIEAGVSLKNGFNDGVKNFFDGIDMTHDEVQKYAPGLYVDREAMDKLNSKLNGVEKYAKGLSERGIDDVDRAQGQYLLRAVDAARSGNGSYKQTVEALRSIGQKAFGAQPPLGQIPHDVEKMRDLYFSIDDALIDTVRKHVNPAFADELTANNKAMSQFFKDRNQVGHVLADPSVAPETAFNRIVMNGDSDQINALRKILPPEEFNRQRGAFLNNLIKREPDGSFNLNSLYSAMRTKEPQLRTLFQDAPDQLQDVGELIKLGDRFGKPILSTSGTGASNVFHHIKESIMRGISNDTVINNLKDKARASGTGVEPYEFSLGDRSPLYYTGKLGQITAPPPAGRSPSDDAIQRRLNSR